MPPPRQNDLSLPDLISRACQGSYADAGRPLAPNQAQEILPAISDLLTDKFPGRPDQAVLTDCFSGRSLAAAEKKGCKANEKEAYWFHRSLENYFADLSFQQNQPEDNSFPFTTK